MQNDINSSIFLESQAPLSNIDYSSLQEVPSITEDSRDLYASVTQEELDSALAEVARLQAISEQQEAARIAAEALATQQTAARIAAEQLAVELEAARYAAEQEADNEEAARIAAEQLTA